VLFPSTLRVQYLNSSSTSYTIFKSSQSSSVCSLFVTISGSFSSIASWPLLLPRVDFFCCSSRMAVNLKSSNGSPSRDALSRASTSPCQQVTFPTRGRKTVASGSNCCTCCSYQSRRCGDWRIQVHILWSLPNAPRFLQCNRFFPCWSSASSSSTSIAFSKASEYVPHKKPLTTRLIICPKQRIRVLIGSNPISSASKYVASSQRAALLFVALSVVKQPTFVQDYTVSGPAILPLPDPVLYKDPWIAPFQAEPHWHSQLCWCNDQ